VAFAPDYTTRNELQSPHGEDELPLAALAFPDLLRCLVLSWSEMRANGLRSAAENEQWRAIVCKDVDQFLRSVFQLNVPLTVVDLPHSDAAGYAKMRKAVTSACGASDSLLVVCGTEREMAEEVWARQLGVWTYLPGASGLSGLELIFEEARQAIARRSSVYVETNAYR